MSANIDLDVNARIVFSLRRKSNFEGSECIEKHQKSTSKRLAKHVDKKFPKIVQKCTEIVLGGFQEASKRMSKSNFNLKKWKIRGQKAGLKTPSKKRAEQTSKKEPVLANEREARSISEKSENMY